MIARLALRLKLRHVAAAMIALAAIAAAAPAPAQNQQPSANSILIAKQIVQLKGVKKMMDPIAIGVVEKVKGMVMQQNFMWQKDIDEVAVQLHKEFDGRATEMIDATARAYASHFTEPELKQILAFYQSPLGQKMIVEEPKAIDESMRGAADWADNLSIDVMKRMRAEMKKRGHDI
jgi:uncharacterized protein